MWSQMDRKGMDAVPTTLVIVVFALLVLVAGLVVLNHGTGIVGGGFNSIEGLQSIIGDDSPGDEGDGSEAVCSATIYVDGENEVDIESDESGELYTDIADYSMLNQIEGLEEDCSIWAYESENPPRYRFGDPDAEDPHGPDDFGWYEEGCSSRTDCQWNRHNTNKDANGGHPAVAIYIAPRYE